MARLEVLDAGNVTEVASPSYPRRRWLVIVISVLAGFLLTVFWSAPFVDRVIGDGVANSLLGHDARETPISGYVAGVLFAFVSGLAGTFTACNVAVFGAVAPLAAGATSVRARVTRAVRPLWWLSVGMIAVSATYGAIVGLVGTRLPQFSTAQSVPGTLSARSVQSMVVFGVIGLAFTYLGLAALGVVPDPLARLARHFPAAPMVVIGALIGGFLVGRPFALFRIMFRDAAESGNPLYGAAAFVLQSAGNIVLIAVLVILLSIVSGGRFGRWLAAKPSRLAVVTAAGFLVAGVFTFLYWDLRILGQRGFIPYPVHPWY